MVDGTSGRHVNRQGLACCLHPATPLRLPATACAAPIGAHAGFGRLLLLNTLSDFASLAARSVVFL